MKPRSTMTVHHFIWAADGEDFKELRVTHSGGEDRTYAARAGEMMIQAQLERRRGGGCEWVEESQEHCAFASKVKVNRRGFKALVSFTAGERHNTLYFKLEHVSDFQH